MMYIKFCKVFLIGSKALLLEKILNKKDFIVAKNHIFFSTNVQQILIFFP